MTETDKLYYKEMLKRERLFPFVRDNRLVCFITFYICNDENKYMEADPFRVLDDIDTGKVCYISQLLTDKNTDNPRLSYEIWHRFKIYIKNSFPLVDYICWRRWNKLNRVVKTYKKEL